MEVNGFSSSRMARPTEIVTPIPLFCHDYYEFCSMIDKQNICRQQDLNSKKRIKEPAMAHTIQCIAACGFHCSLLATLQMIRSFENAIMPVGFLFHASRLSDWEYLRNGRLQSAKDVSGEYHLSRNATNFVAPADGRFQSAHLLA